MATIPTTNWLRKLQPVEGYEFADFIIPVKPVPCPRPRFNKYGQAYMPKTYNAWIREALPYVPMLTPAFAGTVGVAVESVLPQFKTVTRDAPKGDVDNYAKSVMDLLTRSQDFWGDDAQAVLLVSTKRFVEEGEGPHTHVYVKELNPL